jgi:signal transduction histidine kinase
MIEGDPDLLFQMVSNLIDNAIKYTPEHGEIGITVRRSDADAVFEVQDTGIGIPDEEKDQVFQRFYRVGKSRSLPGNGLGLSLVSAVAEIHQGRILLSDTHPGETSPGLTIAVHMPAFTGVRKRIKAAQAELPADVSSTDGNNIRNTAETHDA